MALIDDAMLFIKVAQAGNFTRAAEQLYSSKSHISRRIAELEQGIDTTLFNRSPRGLQLTEAGETFYQACLKVQSEFEAATQQLKNKTDTLNGTLNITAPMTLGSAIIGPLLAKFMKHHPELHISLDLSDTAVNLAESAFDIAIRAARELPDSSLKAKVLYEYGYTISASASYLEQYGRPTNLDSLKHHRAISCITTGGSLKHDSWPFLINGNIEQIPINSVAKVTHMQVQKAFAQEGIGLIRTPSYWVCQEINDGTLLPVLENHPQPTAKLFAVYKNTRIVPNKIRALIDFLSEHLPIALGS